MPFCPSCRYEYKIGVTVCPDCNEKLVDRLPEEPLETDEAEEYKDWIALARLTSSQLAEMVLEALHAKDIPAVLSSTGGHFGQTGQLGMASYRPVAGGYITLMVPKKFVADADKEAEVILGEDWEKAKLIDIR